VLKVLAVEEFLLELAHDGRSKPRLGAAVNKWLVKRPRNDRKPSCHIENLR
jgi:hypothetical protein